MMVEQGNKIDIFVSHNEADAEWAEWVGKFLKAEGYRCVWYVLPGSNRIIEINNAIQQAECIISLLSPAYLKGKQFSQEWATAEERTDSPLLLPILIDKAGSGSLLDRFVPVDFVGLTDEEEAKKRLLAGVRRELYIPQQQQLDKKSIVPPFPGKSSSRNLTPHSSGKNILIVSLGESPVVVTAMYDMLTEDKHLTFEKVIVLCPQNIEDSYNIIYKGFKHQNLLEYEEMSFEDVDSPQNAFKYLRSVYKLLQRYQEAGDHVYLSLAGGRKSMAALMAWVVPFFTCVKALYHLLEKVEGKTLVKIDTLKKAESIERLRELLYPGSDHFYPVEIPQSQDMHISSELRHFIKNASREEIDKLSDEDRLRFFFAKNVIKKNSNPLEILFTTAAKQFYEGLVDKDYEGALQLTYCFEGMADSQRLSQMMTGLYPFRHSIEEIHESTKNKRSSSGKAKVVKLHFYEDRQAPFWPVFYTQPDDISEDLEGKVINQAIICALETAQSEQRKSLKQIATASGFSSLPEPNAKWPLASRAVHRKNSVLIVPLGTSPMVATQLFTLLTTQEKRKITEVILVYPKQNSVIYEGVKIVKKALCEYVNCILEGVSELEDVRSSQDCRKYQQHLESVILNAMEHNSQQGTIDLALSGGRKGMAAMAIFAAQNLRLPFVYHTLIRDQKLSDRIENETSIDELNKLCNNKKELHNRLFLRAYDKSEKYEKFVLFKVPVFPAAQL